jgi:GNAT superfamily N-acetyltransferase
MESIVIRKGRREDMKHVLEMIRELAAYERAPDEVTNTLESLEQDGFDDDPAYRVIVADEGSDIVGMAIYFIKYSTWKGRGIYLEDIIVKESYRNKGIGKKLFNAIIEEAQKTGAKQLHWQVLDWNGPAISFYRKYDASFDREWINCKMNEDQIINFKT